MSPLAAAFARAKAEGRCALVAYLCAGDPDLQTTVELVPLLAAAGADVVELGIPFSDPIADGPVIQAASQRALRSGTSASAVLEAVAQVRQGGCQVPVVLMTYLNPVLALGVEQFVSRAALAKVSGLIIPDLPLEEADLVAGPSERAGVDLVLLAAPTTSPERLARIARRARGFLYFVSVTGVTGTREALPAELFAQLDAARAASPLPLAVGFGISTAAHAAQLRSHADAVVVGSALVSALHQGRGDREPLLGQVRALAAALGRR